MSSSSNNNKDSSSLSILLKDSSSFVSRRSGGCCSKSSFATFLFFTIFFLAAMLWESVHLGHPPRNEINHPIGQGRADNEPPPKPMLRMLNVLPKPEAAAAAKISPLVQTETDADVTITKEEKEITVNDHSVLRTETDAGVTGLDDPILYETVDLHGDSSTATVMGMATGYSLAVYKNFVGSLRKSGFKGNIIIGVGPDVSRQVLDYFAYRNVTAKILTWVPCTYENAEDKQDIFQKTKCSDPYPDIKIRWSRFPLQRDWLNECTTCTGPVLIMDVRDSYFQVDPFGPNSPPIQGLQVFQEHESQTTGHWLVYPIVEKCKGEAFIKPMLCSGSTIGTRAAMLKYLEIMYAEMKVWINTPKCRFNLNGDDQTIHNYLFYTGQLPFAHSIPNRMGIVNTVGVPGAKTLKAKQKELHETEGLDAGAAANRPYPGANNQTWIGTVEFNITVDDHGYFTQLDGTRSRAIHQYDRYGTFFMNWLNNQDFMKDTMAETM